MNTILAATTATTTGARRSGAKPGAAQPAGDRVSIGADADPIARVDRMIADIRSGRIQWAPEIAAKFRQDELTLSNFPCQKYMLEPGKKPIASADLATEIVPKGEKSHYKHAVTVDSKLNAKQNRKDLGERVDSIRSQTRELRRQKTESLAILIEGDNAAGKDGILDHVFQVGVLSSDGVVSLKGANEEERKHDPNWRVLNNLPGPGLTGFQNRTAYGDVVFASKTPQQKAERIAGIIELEYGLTMGLPMTPEGRIALPDANHQVDPTAIQRPPMRFFKVVPHISEAEQASRLAERLVNDRKADKLSLKDVEGHPNHLQIQSDFLNAMAAASRPWAPAYYLPHDNKETGWRKLAQMVDGILEDMDPQRPGTTVPQSDRLAAARPLQAEARAALRKRYRD